MKNDILSVKGEKMTAIKDLLRSFAVELAVFLGVVIAIAISLAVFPKAVMAIPLWINAFTVHLSFSAFFEQNTIKELGWEKLIKAVIKGLFCPILVIADLYDIFVFGVRRKAFYEESHTRYFGAWIVPGLAVFTMAFLWYGGGNAYTMWVILGFLLFSTEIWWLKTTPGFSQRETMEKPILKGLIMGFGAPIYVLHYLLEEVMKKIE